MLNDENESDILMVLSTLDLANPIYEKLLNKYLVDGKWEELLVKMWNAYQIEKESLSQEESEAIISFISQCISFIEDCIRYDIINVTVQPLQPCVPDSEEAEPSVIPSAPESVHFPLTSSVSEQSESSISFVCIHFIS